jgi:DNA-binding beta-propeller fold protein YncE
MNSAMGLAYDATGNRLFVAESSGHRVKVWDVASITDGENAVNVLGQSTFTGNLAGNTQTGMNGPRGIVFDSATNRLFVAQLGSHRVTVYDVASVTDGENAVNVLGQSVFTANGIGNSNTGMSSPVAVGFDSVNKRLLVSQGGNNRITLYDVATAPTITGMTSSTASGNKFTGDTIAVQVQFSEAVTVTGTPTLKLETGTTDAVVNYTSGSGTNTLTFNYTVAAGHTSDRLEYFDTASLVLNGGTIRSATLSDAQLGFPLPYTRGYLGASKLFQINPTRHLSDNKLASDLMGQYTSSTVLAPNYTATAAVVSDVTFTNPAGMVIDTTNHRLFVAEQTNNRVLVFNLDTNNILNDKIADAVLGQANFTTSGSGTTSSTLNNPQSVAYSPSLDYLFVSELNNNRVMVFDVDTITNGEAAVHVLGQPDFVTSTNATTQTKMNFPTAMDLDETNNRLFVAESANNRVLVFDVTAVSTGEPAVNVLGQDDFVSSAASVNTTDFSQPRGVTYDGSTNRLYVGASNHNRIMVFDVATITDGEAAINVLGQPTFFSALSATTQAGLNTPYELAIDEASQRLFVVDQANHRVLSFNVATIVDGENAENILGQTSYYGATGSTTQTSFNTPQGILFDATNDKLFVSQLSNDRISIFDVADAPRVTSVTSSTSNGQKVTGDTLSIQVNFNVPVTVTGTPTLTLETGTTDAVLNYVSGSGTSTLTFDYTVASTHTTSRLEVQSTTALALAGGTIKDALNNDATLTLSFTTALSANELFTINFSPALTSSKNATDILGQYSTTGGFLNSFTTSTAQNSFGSAYPLGLNNGSRQTVIDTVNHRLFVADLNNLRVLVFNLDSNNNLIDKTPDAVLGKANFTDGTTVTVTSQNTGAVNGLSYDATNQRLFVSVSSQNRVLVFNVASITNGEPAVNVLGQANFTASGSAVTSTGVSGPETTAYDSTGNRLFVNDAANKRILVYDVTAISDGEAAVAVLGAADFVTPGSGSVTQNSFGDTPRGIVFDANNNRLFVSGGFDDRVLVFDVTAITNGENAVNVLGQ